MPPIVERFAMSGHQDPASLSTPNAGRPLSIKIEKPELQQGTNITRGWAKSTALVISDLVDISQSSPDRCHRFEYGEETVESSWASICSREARCLFPLTVKPLMGLAKITDSIPSIHECSKRYADSRLSEITAIVIQRLVRITLLRHPIPECLSPKVA